MTIRRRPCAKLNTDNTAGTRAIVDHNLLAQPFGQPLRDHARDSVCATTRCKWNDEANRPAGIWFFRYH
jgi:hypothetical protein